jgi:hypothetical protein
MKHKLFLLLLIVALVLEDVQVRCLARRILLLFASWQTVPSLQTLPTIFFFTQIAACRPKKTTNLRLLNVNVLPREKENLLAQPRNPRLLLAAKVLHHQKAPPHLSNV